MIKAAACFLLIFKLALKKVLHNNKKLSTIFGQFSTGYLRCALVAAVTLAAAALVYSLKQPRKATV